MIFPQFSFHASFDNFVKMIKHKAATWCTFIDFSLLLFLWWLFHFSSFLSLIRSLIFFCSHQAPYARLFPLHSGPPWYVVICVIMFPRWISLSLYRRFGFSFFSFQQMLFISSFDFYYDSWCRMFHECILQYFSQDGSFKNKPLALLMRTSLSPPHYYSIFWPLLFDIFCWFSMMSLPALPLQAYFGFSVEL